MNSKAKRFQELKEDLAQTQSSLERAQGKRSKVLADLEEVAGTRSIKKAQKKLKRLAEQIKEKELEFEKALEEIEID